MNRNRRISRFMCRFCSVRICPKKMHHNDARSLPENTRKINVYLHCALGVLPAATASATDAKYTRFATAILVADAQVAGQYTRPLFAQTYGSPEVSGVSRATTPFSKKVDVVALFVDV